MDMLAGRSWSTEARFPISPGPPQKKAENFQNRQKADPLAKCYMPGVPRIMYLDFPFQIFQTPQAIAMAFEWALDYRLIYTNGIRTRADDSSGWAIRAAIGTATRWWSTSPTTTTKHGSTWRATFTATRCMWSSDTA